MSRVSVLILAAIAALTLSLSDLADARRMGGGRSFGAQRESITPSRPASAPATPAGNAATQAQPASGAAKAAPNAAPAPSGASRWLGPIAGIAAGLGLAALMSHFGLSEGFGSLLLIALVVIGAIFLLRMFLSRRQQPGAPLQYAGAGANATPAASSATVPTWRIPSKNELAGGDVATPAQDAPEFGVTHKALPQGFDA